MSTDQPADRSPVNGADVVADWLEEVLGLEVTPWQRRALAAPRLDVDQLHAQQRAERAAQRRRIDQLDAYLNGRTNERTTDRPPFTRAGARPSYVVVDEAHLFAREA